MKLLRKKSGSFLLALAFLLVLSGCMPAVKSNVPELEAKVKKFRKVVLLTPKIDIYELNAAEDREKRDDWSEAGRRNVEKAITKALKERGVKVYTLKRTSRNKEEIEDIQQLYRAVAASIYSHTYWPGQNPNLFVERVQNFDYTIGSVNKFLKERKADGLLIVYGLDEISTKGRKALEVVRAINIFDSRRGGGETVLEMGVTDSTGAVLWLRSRANAGGYDLRDPESSEAFVKTVLRDYPRGKK